MQFKRKIIDLDTEYLGNKETRIVPVVQTNLGFELDDRRIKTAACDEAREFILNIEPIDGYKIILVSALGSSEYWGGNKKADAFPYNAIHGLPPKDVPLSLFDRFKHRLPTKYGMSTFTTVYDENGNQIGGGNTFREHDNKVPRDLLGKPFDLFNKRDPRMGFVLAQFWNPEMKRVEVVQTVSKTKLPTICLRIDKGELIGISMACDVPVDRCGKCNNLSHNDKTYCEHLKDIRVRGMIDENGKPHWMFNDFPVFFDSTLTERPAAVEGRMLSKVASLYYFSGIQTFEESQDYYGNDYLTKIASMPGMDDYAMHIASKSAPNDIEQRAMGSNIKLDTKVPGFNLDSMVKAESNLEPQVIHQLRNIPIDSLIPNLATLGVFPNHTDYANLLFDVTPNNAEKIGLLSRDYESNFHKNHSNGIDYRDVLSEYNQFREEKRIPSIEIKIVIETEKKSEPENVFGQILNLIQPYLKQKSYLPEFLFQRKPVNMMTIKSASDIIDARDNLHQLSQQAQTVLLVKLLSNKDLLPEVASLLKSYYIQSELKRLGIDPLDLSFSSVGFGNSINDIKRDQMKFYAN